MYVVKSTAQCNQRKRICRSGCLSPSKIVAVLISAHIYSRAIYTCNECEYWLSELTEQCKGNRASQQADFEARACALTRHA